MNTFPSYMQNIPWWISLIYCMHVYMGVYKFLNAVAVLSKITKMAKFNHKHLDKWYSHGNNWNNCPKQFSSVKFIK